MRLLATQFTLSTSALEIYFAGCNGPHCKNCHNPESHSFDVGTELSPAEIYATVKAKVESAGSLVESIRLFGGEPLDQPLKEISDLANFLRNLGKPLWLFTRYKLSEIPHYIRLQFDYIKTGRYDEELLINNHVEYGVTLASSNQRVYRITKDY